MPAGAPPIRRLTSFFHEIMCSTISQIVCAPGSGRLRRLLVIDAFENLPERAAVPGIAGMLALELVDDAGDLGGHQLIPAGARRDPRPAP